MYGEVGIKSMRVYELSVSTTRRCNMRCDACLRGEPETVDIDERVMPKVFDEVGVIRRLCITGGEPTLNVPALRQIVSLMESRKCVTENIFLITNGKEYAEEVCELFRRMVELCTRNVSSEFVLATSEFHESAPGVRDYMRWRHENSARYIVRKVVGNPQSNWVIDTGRAQTMGLGRRGIPGIAWGPFVVLAGGEIRRIFVSCRGDVCTTCDISYEDIERLKKGNLIEEPLADIVERNKV